MANEADLKLIQIPEFPRTTSVTGSGNELIVVSKADGKTYGIKTSDFKAFLGTVQVTTPRPIKPTDPAPTLDGVYIPTVNGTYANAGGLTLDFSSGGADYGMMTQFIKNGSVWVKNSYPLPQAENKITLWIDSKEGGEGIQRIDKGYIWQANAPVTGTDVPGVSDKWDLKTGEISNSFDLIQFIDNSGNVLGYFDEKGVFRNRGLEGEFHRAVSDKIRVKEDGDNLIEIEDSSGSIIASLNHKGQLQARIQPNTVNFDALYNAPIMVSDKDEGNLIEFTDYEGNVIARFDADGKLVVKNIEVLQGIKGEASYSGELEKTTETKVRITRPKYLELDILGVLPTDISDARAETRVEVVFRDGGTKLLKANAELSIQGSGSSRYAKKGYTLDLFNSDWEKLEVKVGDMVLSDSFHLKAGHTDITHTRDLGTGRLWYECILKRPFPLNLVSPLPASTLFPLDSYNAKTMYVEDAKFFTDGMPCGIYLNGSFHGLHSFRQKKTRGNYKLDNGNENHIFLENDVSPTYIGNNSITDFDSVTDFWEIRSPKSPTQTTKDNILRYFDYCRGVYDGTINLRDTYQDYFVLESLIDLIIIGELVYHQDFGHNNLFPITYDGQHWGMMLYDLDNSIGIYSVLSEAPNNYIMQKDIFAKIYQEFKPEIKVRYAYLRDEEVISNENFKRIYGGISMYVPTEVYEANYAKWGCQTTNAFPTMQHLYKYLNDRMLFLDSEWLI